MGSGQADLASQHNDRRDDSRASSFLFAHQMLGSLALSTVPTNGQVVPIVINGTTITITAVTSIGSTANNVLIGGSAAGSANWSATVTAERRGGATAVGTRRGESSAEIKAGTGIPCPKVTVIQRASIGRACRKNWRDTTKIGRDNTRKNKGKEKL